MASIPMYGSINRVANKYVGNIILYDNSYGGEALGGNGVSLRKCMDGVNELFNTKYEATFCQEFRALQHSVLPTRQAS